MSSVTIADESDGIEHVAGRKATEVPLSVQSEGGAPSNSESVQSTSSTPSNTNVVSDTVTLPIVPDPRTVFLPIRLHSIETTYIAKSNHFLQCDPLVVVAIENKPIYKTSIRSNSMTCSWDLSKSSDIEAVPGGLVLESDAIPVIQIPIADLSTSRIQVHQEDFSKLKVDDDMGSFSMRIEDIVTKSWKVPDKKVSPFSGLDALTARTILSRPATAPASSFASKSLSSASSSSYAASTAATPSIPSPVVDGWYPVSIEKASLIDRNTQRHLGEISLKLTIQLEPYLRYLVASQTNLHLLYELTSQFLANPSTDTPLKHVVLDPPSLKAFIAFIVKAGADKGSMDGERMRERLYPFIHKLLDVFKPESTILDTFFDDDSQLWTTLFQIRKCVPLSTLSSSSAFHSFESFLDAHMTLIERVGLLLEPPPPPPVKSEEELALEAAAEAAAAKRAALKEKKRRAAAIAAGEDPDDIRPKSASTKKKKSLMSGSSLPDPPAHPPSSLQFGLNTIDLMHELFDCVRVRLTGFKRATDLDFASEQKMIDFVHCCDLLYKLQAFLFRYGAWSTLPPPDPLPAADGTTVEVDSASSSSTTSTLTRRVGVEEIRSFFMKETADPNALWFQKQLVASVKKTRDYLAEVNKETFVKLQQHADWWTKLYPVEKVAKEKSGSKSGSKKK